MRGEARDKGEGHTCPWIRYLGSVFEENTETNSYFQGFGQSAYVAI